MVGNIAQGRPFLVSLLVALFMLTQVIWPSYIALGQGQTIVNVNPGTLVVLRLNETVTSKASAGKELNTQVLQDVVVNGYTVIKAGTPARASIASAERAKMLGKEGELNITVSSTTTVDGQRVFLSGNLSSEGAEKVGSTIVLGAFICPLFLMRKGGQAIIPEGAEIKTYVANSIQVRVP